MMRGLLGRVMRTMVLVAVTAVAWIAIVVRASTGGNSSEICCVPASQGTPFRLGWLWNHSQPSAIFVSWALMLAAMMTPMLAEPLKSLCDRSLIRRRWRTVTLFLIGYFGTWMLAGLPILIFVLGIRLLIADPVAQTAEAALIAVVWQCSPLKQRCLNRLHTQPDLVAFGWTADFDAIRCGAKHGGWCVASCWAVMAFSETCSVGHAFAMAVVTLWLLAEHLERPKTPKWHLPHVAKSARIVAWALGVRYPAEGDSLLMLGQSMNLASLSNKKSVLSPVDSAT